MKITRTIIEDKVMDLMIEFGPDGHTDGSDKITDYIESIRKSDMKELVKMIPKDEEVLKSGCLTSVLNIKNCIKKYYSK